MEFIQENVSAVAAKFGTTPEVLQKFLTDAQAAAEVQPFADSLGLFEVFKPEELTTRISNETKTAVEKAVNDTKGVTWGIADKKVLAETGIEKKPGEQSLEYLIRATKEKYGSKGTESDELQRLRSDLEAKDRLLTEKDTKLQEIEVKHATERKQGDINATLDAAINSLPINADEKFIGGQRTLIKVMLEQKYDIDVVEGKVQFTDKATKEVKRDGKTAAPMTAAALIAEFAPTVVQLKTPSVTTGSGFKSSSTNLNDGDASQFDYTQYATKEDFAKALNKAGISSGSPRGTELFAAFKKANPAAK